MMSAAEQERVHVWCSCCRSYSDTNCDDDRAEDRPEHGAAAAEHDHHHHEHGDVDVEQRVREDRHLLERVRRADQRR